MREAARLGDGRQSRGRSVLPPTSDTSTARHPSLVYDDVTPRHVSRWALKRVLSAMRWLLPRMLGRWLVGGGRASSTVLSGGRSPLITFPQRSDSNGQREREEIREIWWKFLSPPSALVRLSLEHVQLSPPATSTPAVGGATAKSHTHSMTSLPVSFGRLPLSHEEMEAINVNFNSHYQSEHSHNYVCVIFQSGGA